MEEASANASAGAQVALGRIVGKALTHDGHWEAECRVVKFPPCAKCGPAFPHNRPGEVDKCPNCGEPFPPPTETRVVEPVVTWKKPGFLANVKRFFRGG